MNYMKINKINKYALLLVAVTTLSCGSLSFGMDIFEKINKKDIQEVKKILNDALSRKLFTANIANKDGYTPLNLACKNDDFNIVKLLLENGAEESINIASKDGLTPLYWACRNNNLEIVELLLDRDADANIIDEAGRTPLHWACNHYNKKIVELLLESEAYIIEEFNGITPLHLICEYNEKDTGKDIVILLLNYGADINIVDNDYGKTPLNLACKNDDLNIVTLLLESGAKESINIASKDGKTPLYWACKNNNFNMVTSLLKNGADVNIANKDGKTPLYLACKNNNFNMVTSLLESGAKESINKANNNGRTPLYKACENNNKDIVELLLNNGADVNIANKDGETPFYWAFKNNNLDIIKMLLANGAQKYINIANKDGYTPFYLVFCVDDIDMVELFLENGADVNIANKDGCTPLNFACYYNKLYAVELLLISGANIDQESLDIADNNPEIRSMLNFVQQYDNSTDKVEFIVKQQDDNKYDLLIKRAFVQYLNEIQKNCRSIDGMVFGKLYDQLKDNKKFKEILDVSRNFDNIYEFIKSTAKNNQIYLEKGLIEKKIIALKSKAALKKQKFTDVTIKFAEGDKENMEDEESNQIIQNLVKGFANLLKKRKREENKEKESQEEEDYNVDKKRKL